MTKITEDNKTHSASGQYTDTPDNTASLKEAEEKPTEKHSQRQGDHHKQKEDQILELEDKIDVLKTEAAKLNSEGKTEAEKEKQREMSHAHEELVKLRAEAAK